MRNLLGNTRYGPEWLIYYTHCCDTFMISYYVVRCPQPSAQARHGHGRSSSRFFALDDGVGCSRRRAGARARRRHDDGLLLQSESESEARVRASSTGTRRCP